MAISAGTTGTHELMALVASAEAALRSRRFPEAEQALRTALAAAPAFTGASVMLATCLEMQSRLRDAIEVLEQSAARQPSDRDVLHYLARLQTLVGDNEDAIARYRALAELDRFDIAAWILLAQVYRTVGRRPDSVSAFREVIALDPGNGPAWWSLAQYFPSEINDEDIGRMRTALSQRLSNPNDSGPLHIALGLVADRRGETEEAFAHISAGKRIRASQARYDPAWVTTEVDQTIGSIPPGMLAAGDPTAKAVSGPIFLVGMPRSGSTLLERVLGGHPAIEPGGELPLINAVVEQVRQRAAGRSTYHDYLASMPEQERRELGQWYLDRAQDYRRSDKCFFIDKWNSNWLHAGLIRLILPEAPIVDLRRGALDCCWSNYKMMFGSGLAFSNDLGFLGRFYRDYVRQMDWLRGFAPERVHLVHYEEMVEDLERETRRLLDFIGVEFDPACIDFSRSGYAVATPSSEQVRRPINRDSIGSAEPYRRWLGPLVEELGELARPAAASGRPGLA